MPTYEYRCSKGHEFEQVQRMSEEPLRICTICGAPAERVLSTGAGLLFRGSGFYITDYRSDAYKKAADSDKSDAKPAKEGKSDSSGSGSSSSSGSGSSGSGSSGSSSDG